MSAEKRPADGYPSSQVLVKRQNVTASNGALARLNASNSQNVRMNGVEILYTVSDY